MRQLRIVWCETNASSSCGAARVSPHSDGRALPSLTPPAPKSNNSQPSTRLCWQPGPNARAYSPVWRTAQFSNHHVSRRHGRDGGAQVDFGLRERLALGRRGPVRVGKRQAAQLNVLDPPPLREIAGQQDQVSQPRRDDDRLLRVFARLGHVGQPSARPVQVPFARLGQGLADVDHQVAMALVEARPRAGAGRVAADGDRLACGSIDATRSREAVHE